MTLLDVDTNGLLGSDSLSIKDEEILSTWAIDVDSARGRCSKTLTELAEAVREITTDKGLNEKGRAERKREAARAALDQIEKAHRMNVGLRDEIEKVADAIPTDPAPPKDLRDPIAAAVWGALDRMSEGERRAFVERAGRQADRTTLWAALAAPASLRGLWAPEEVWEAARSDWRKVEYGPALSKLEDLQQISRARETNFKKAERKAQEMGGLGQAREFVPAG